MSQKISHDEACAVMRNSGFEPLEQYVSPQSPWKCRCTKCELESSPTYANVKNLGTGCRHCKRNQLDQNVLIQRLALQNLELISDYVSSRVPIKLVCNVCKHGFEATTRQIKSVLVPCPECRDKERIEFASDAVEIMLSVGLEPIEPYKNSKTPWLSKCLVCEREVSPQLGSIKSGHAGCIYCAGLKIDSEDAIATMLAADLRPLDPFVSGKSRWRCLCLQCGDETYPRYAAISVGSGGCKRCGIVKRAKSKTFEESVARQFMLDADLEPLEPYVNQKHGWKCRCLNCGNEVFPMLNTIRNGDGGCKFCGKNYVDPLEAELFFKSKGFTPQEEYPGANSGWHSIHNLCGNEVAPLYSSIKAGGGCKFCTNKGFQFHLPGYLYLIANEKMGALKVGIATSGIRQDRLNVHVRHGWLLYRKIHFDIGNDAYLLEQEVLKWMREEMKLPAFLTAMDMPQGGWTETVSDAEIDLPTIWEKVREIREQVAYP
jgi:hypothetical protein